MAGDETALPRIDEELEKSRESAARLLDSLAQKLRFPGAVRHAATGIERAAHYVQVHSVKDVATGIGRLVRRRPAPTLLLAVIAGFLVGRALRTPRAGEPGGEDPW